MIIRIISAITDPVLLGPAEFGGFSVDATGVDDIAVSSSLARAGAGEVVGDHAFIEPDAVRRMAGDVVDGEWEHGFARMVDYARANGWLDEAGRIRAHIERN